MNDVKSLTLVLVEKIEGVTAVRRPQGTLREGVSYDPYLGERSQAHKQKEGEDNSGDGRTTPPIAHLSGGFIATKITSASKPGPQPLLTSFIILQSRSGDRVEGEAMTSHVII